MEVFNSVLSLDFAVKRPKFDDNGSRLLPARPQRLQGFLHQPPANFFFLLRRDLGVAHHVNDAVTENGAVGAHHLGNR